MLRRSHGCFSSPSTARLRIVMSTTWMKRRFRRELVYFAMIRFRWNYILLPLRFLIQSPSAYLSSCNTFCILQHREPQGLIPLQNQNFCSVSCLPGLQLHNVLITISLEFPFESSLLLQPQCSRLLCNLKRVQPIQCTWLVPAQCWSNPSNLSLIIYARVSNTLAIFRFRSSWTSRAAPMAAIEVTARAAILNSTCFYRFWWVYILFLPCQFSCIVGSF